METPNNPARTGSVISIHNIEVGYCMKEEE